MRQEAHHLVHFYHTAASNARSGKVSAEFSRVRTLLFVLAVLACHCGSGPPTASPSMAPAPVPSTVAATPPPGQAGSQKGQAAPSNAGPQPEPSGTVRLRRQHPDDPIPAQLSELPGFTDAGRVARSVDYGPESVARGRKMYQNACAPCHQMSGEGMPGRNYGVKTLPRDLREPEYYRYGSSDRALYRTIVHGIPGSPMGSFDGMPPAMAWDLVHYVRSLYKPEMP